MLIHRIVDNYLEKHPRDVRKATLLAVIFKRTTIISYGFNRKTFCPNRNTKIHRFTIHAEDAALEKAGNRARGADILVVRFKKDGTSGISKPCKQCELHIRKAGIARVRYIDNNGKIACMQIF